MPAAAPSCGRERKRAGAQAGCPQWRQSRVAAGGILQRGVGWQGQQGWQGWQAGAQLLRLLLRLRLLLCTQLARQMCTSLAGVQGHLLLPVRHERLLPGWSQSPNLHAGRQARQQSSRHIVTANALLKCTWAGLQQHANGPRGRSPLVGGAAGLLAVTAATAGGGVAAVAASPAADAWGVKLVSKRPRRVLAR